MERKGHIEWATSLITVINDGSPEYRRIEQLLENKHIQHDTFVIDVAIEEACIKYHGFNANNLPVLIVNTTDCYWFDEASAIINQQEEGQLVIDGKDWVKENEENEKALTEHAQKLFDSLFQ